MNRSDILAKAKTLSRAGFGPEDRLAFLLAVASQIYEGKLDDGVPLRNLFQLADDLELALGNQEIVQLLTGVSFLQIKDKHVKCMTAWDSLGSSREWFMDALGRVVGESKSANTSSAVCVEPAIISEILILGHNWVQRIVAWCEENKILACPVFWSYGSDDVYPLARAIGSFSTVEIALLVVQGKRYGLASAPIANDLVLDFFGRFLVKYSNMHEALRGAIVFDELDDDYPGSDSAPFQSSTLTCPAVNSSAQALFVCALADLPSLADSGEGLLRFVLGSQNEDGSWPIFRFSALELCPAQVMSSALALEALGALSKRATWLGQRWRDFEEDVARSVSRGFEFSLSRLKEIGLIDAGFEGGGNEYARLGTTAIALHGMLQVVTHRVLQDQDRKAFWEVFESWLERIEQSWLPDWRNVIRVRIPVPQWGGTFDAGQFSWELPYDAVVATVLIEAEVDHGSQLSGETRAKIFSAVSETLAIQKQGIWRDIPMALERNDRGFPQNSQICARLLWAYLASLRKQMKNGDFDF